MLRKLPWILVLLGAGCAGASMTSYSPITEKTKHSEDVLFKASAAELEAKGYAAQLDHDNYRLRTREKEVAISSVPRLSYKYTLQIETKAGTLVISSNCKANSATSRTAFEDCGDERPERLVNEQEQLRTDILVRAQRVEKEE